MASPSLFEGAISALHKALNIGALQNKVLTSNIANIDTPNYKAFEVVMEDELKKNGSPTTTINLVCTQPQHLAGRHGPHGITVGVALWVVRIAQAPVTARPVFLVSGKGLRRL